MTHFKPSAGSSTLDDPVVLSAVLPLRFFWGEARHARNRWSLCAKEICFRSELLRCQALMKTLEPVPSRLRTGMCHLKGHQARHERKRWALLRRGDLLTQRAAVVNPGP